MTTWGQPKKRPKATTATKRAPAKPAPQWHLHRRRHARGQASARTSPGRRGPRARVCRDRLHRRRGAAGPGHLPRPGRPARSRCRDRRWLADGCRPVPRAHRAHRRSVPPWSARAAACTGSGSASAGGCSGWRCWGCCTSCAAPTRSWPMSTRSGRAGGWLGALVGEPLRGLIASGGAIVVLVADVRRRRAGADRRIAASDVVADWQRGRCRRRADRAPGTHGVRQRVDVEERSPGHPVRSPVPTSVRRGARRRLV